MFSKIIAKMQKRKDYLTAPATIVAIIVFIFWLWISRATLNGRVNRLEEFQSSINMVEIQSTLSQIQTDIQRIKNSLSIK